MNASLAIFFFFFFLAYAYIPHSAGMPWFLILAYCQCGVLLKFCPRVSRVERDQSYLFVVESAAAERLKTWAHGSSDTGCVLPACFTTEP